MFEDSLTNIHGGGVIFGLDYSARQTVKPDKTGKKYTAKSPINGIALVQGTIDSKRLDYTNKISVSIGTSAVFSGAAVKGDNSILIYVNKDSLVSLETDSSTELNSVSFLFIPFSQES